MRFSLFLISIIFTFSCFAQDDTTDVAVIDSFESRTILTLMDSLGNSTLDTLYDLALMPIVAKRGPIPKTSIKYSIVKLKRKPKKKQVESVIEGSLLFCGGVDDTIPIGVSNKFFFVEHSNYVYGFYNQETILTGSVINIEVKNVAEVDTENANITTLKIKKNWLHTFFKCYFTEPGDYTVTIYDELEREMASGQFSIVSN